MHALDPDVCLLFPILDYGGGSMSGWCYSASGTGRMWTVWGPKLYTWVWTGPVVVFTGQVTGVLEMAPAAAAEAGCVPGASLFDLSGTFALE